MTVHFRPGSGANKVTVNARSLERDGMITSVWHPSYLWIFSQGSPYLTLTLKMAQVMGCQYAIYGRAPT